MRGAAIIDARVLPRIPRTRAPCAESSIASTTTNHRVVGVASDRVPPRTPRYAPSWRYGSMHSSTILPATGAMGGKQPAGEWQAQAAIVYR